MRILYNGMLNMILIKPNETNNAKPIDTTIRISGEDSVPCVTRLTCCEKTSKPGSAIEITKPKINPATITIINLFVLAI